MLLISLQDISAYMSIKVYFLNSHLDKFPDNCGEMMSKENDSIKISKQWKNATRDGGTSK